MAQEIKMPASGQTAAESLILKWNVREGDEINRGDVLFEIETDKATMNVESFAKGTLLKIFFQEGEKVEAGKVVALIGRQGEAYEPQQQPDEKAAVDEDEYQPILKKDAIGQAPQVGGITPDSVAMASPAAKILAKEKKIDIGALFARLGRVVKRADVQNACSYEKSQADYEIIVPSAMRRTIARRMLESTMLSPQYTVSIKADMTNMIALRSQINSSLRDRGVKVSLNDLLVKCVCCACDTVPYINAQYISEQEIRLYRNVNVGIAVALPDGLVVPVIEGANKLGLMDVATQSAKLIAAAKNGTLLTEQMQGGNITISNLGMFGIDRFTALINRPESAILAVGAVTETPVAQNSAVVVRPMMDITASFDHRMVDGGVGAQFMAELKKQLEQPILALLKES